MKKALIIAAILGAGVALFLVLWRPEPQYQARTVSWWLDNWAAGNNSRNLTAIQHFGTNAIPYAVRDLALNDSSWHSHYLRLWYALPQRLNELIPKPEELKEVDVMNMLADIGSNSIPQAIALLKHRSPSVRCAAAWSLAPLRAQSPLADQAIPALIEALSDEDYAVRFDAAFALKEMGPDASNAVPALTKLVANTGFGTSTNSDFSLRAVSAMALGKIGPPAAGALPVLKAALLASNSYLRGQLAVAIWRINADVDTALPVLLREMPGMMEDFKWDWIVALGEMGPRAKEAVPQLRMELAQDKKAWVLEHVTNALKNIDPQAAAEAGVK